MSKPIELKPDVVEFLKQYGVTIIHAKKNYFYLPYWLELGEEVRLHHLESLPDSIKEMITIDRFKGSAFTKE